MDVTELINKLLVGIKNPAFRMEVASTINYLLDVYSNSVANEDDIRNDLYDICSTVLSISNPDKSKEEITEMAKDMAEQFVRTFKITSLSRRAMSKYKVPL